MKWQCTFCGIEAESYEDSAFETCKRNRHEILEMLEEKDIKKSVTVQEMPQVVHVELTHEQYVETLTEKRRKLWDAIEKNFPKKSFPLEVCLAVKAQLFIEDITQPFALFLMGQPSSCKSTILEIVNSLSDSYKSDRFTPRSFVSHSANIPKAKLAEIDLLPRIQHKTLITPELAPLFTGDEETLVDTFGVLTRVLDGRGLELDSGTHGKRGYSGDYYFMWLGAVVDIPHKVWRTVGNLGAKWYYLRLPDDDLTSEQKMQAIIKSLQSAPYGQKIRECQENMVDFWEFFTSRNPDKIRWDTAKNDSETLKRIIEIATLLSRLRASIPTWHTSDPASSGTNYHFEMPVIEDPSRASSALYNLARGHAILYGRNYITKDDLSVVIAVALSSAERERVVLLRLLLENDGKVDTETFVRDARVSDNTARKEMQKLHNLGLVDLTEEPTTTRPKLVAVLKAEFSWFLSSEFKQYWNKFVPLHTPVSSALSFESAEKKEVQEDQTTLDDSHGDETK